jgi:hypothetical protein
LIKHARPPSSVQSFPNQGSRCDLVLESGVSLVSLRPVSRAGGLIPKLMENYITLDHCGEYSWYSRVTLLPSRIAVPLRPARSGNMCGCIAPNAGTSDALKGQLMSRCLSALTGVGPVFWNFGRIGERSACLLKLQRGGVMHLRIERSQFHVAHPICNQDTWTVMPSIVKLRLSIWLVLLPVF